MKTRTLTQEAKLHNTNALHDAFINAGLIPLQVLSEDGPSALSTFVFEDDVTDAAINAVFNDYTFQLPPAPVDVTDALQEFHNAVDGATTLAEIKSLLNNELAVIIREALRSRTVV